MSVLLRLCCDHRGGGACGAHLQTAHADHAAARRYARRQGWTSSGDLDYCPRHDPDAPPRPRIAFDTDPHT